jgi:hypothetical protein
VVDEDDPYLDEYRQCPSSISTLPASGSMVTQLNVVAVQAAASGQWDHIGFIGDDHRFRTPGWDLKFETVLNRNQGGFAYGNDLFWKHGEIPTQIVMSASLIRALGWMGLPSCKHLYIDNVWRVLGEATDSLFYFEDVVIEHLHPAAGKAQWDDQYRRLNSEERYAADRQAFNTWLAGEAPKDITRVREALICAV